MLAIEVTFLTGRYVATAHHDRAEPEWPPHPARLHSALVAAWAEHDEPSTQERRVLTLLESLGAPQITFSQSSRRGVVTHFVPVNDASVLGVSAIERRAAQLTEALAAVERAGSGDTKAAAKALAAAAASKDVASLVAEIPNSAVKAAAVATAAEVLPGGRNRQARLFPSVTPEEPVVVYTWPEAELDAAQVDVLDGLLARVTRLGHSSTLTSCRVIVNPPPPTLVPHAGSDQMLRTVAPGQTDALERAFLRHRGSDPRTLPFRGTPYGRPDNPIAEVAAASLLAGEWFVLEFAASSRKLPMTRVVDVAQAVRGALMRHGDQPVPEAISGHDARGLPTRDPHVSFLPIPFVGREHASGALLGCAVVLPRSADRALATAVMRALARWSQAGGKIHLGRSGVVPVVHVEESDLFSLRRATWERPSAEWVSVTPIALPHHPGKLDHGEPAKRAKAWLQAEQLIAECCEQVGLPEPLEVEAQRAPWLLGSRPCGDFPAFLQLDRKQGRPIARLQVHAKVRFAAPVLGPLALGSGRFFGLGLMRPVAS